MLIRFGFGQLYIGRPTGIGCYRYSAGITLCVGFRGDVPLGELRWRRTYCFNWNWLPDRLWREDRDFHWPDPLLASYPQHRLVSVISGKPALSANAENALLNMSRSTGRGRKFVGFGRWRSEATAYRSTRRSKMYVYLTGAKERRNPKHILRVAPAGVVGVSKAPAEWVNEDNTPKAFELEFIHGRCSVDSQLGEWLVKTGQCQRTNLIRRSGSMLGSLAATIRGA